MTNRSLNSAKRFFAALARFFEPTTTVTHIEYREAATHALKLDGIRGFVMHTERSGRRIVVSGWYLPHWKWKEGDYLLLDTEGRTTRYKIEKMTRFTDPQDQYFAECTFAPRGLGQ
jgi:hypothetical protein